MQILIHMQAISKKNLSKEQICRFLQPLPSVCCQSSHSITLHIFFMVYLLIELSSSINLLEPRFKEPVQVSEVVWFPDVGSHVLLLFTTQLNKACCILSLWTNIFTGSHKGVIYLPCYLFIIHQQLRMFSQEVFYCLCWWSALRAKRSPASFWKTSAGVWKKAW